MGAYHHILQQAISKYIHIFKHNNNVNADMLNICTKSLLYPVTQHIDLHHYLMYMLAILLYQAQSNTPPPQPKKNSNKQTKN
jgi:hypothetical protein